MWISNLIGHPVFLFAKFVKLRGEGEQATFQIKFSPPCFSQGLIGEEGPLLVIKGASPHRTAPSHRRADGVASLQAATSASSVSWGSYGPVVRKELSGEGRRAGTDRNLSAPIPKLDAAAICRGTRCSCPQGYTGTMPSLQPLREVWWEL